MLESPTRRLSTSRLTTIVASPCAPVVIGLGSSPPFRTAMYVSGNDVSPTSSLQLPTATSVASVTPPNQTCLRMSASLTPRGEDRKSTRLNSSHSQISYAVFCLKKKKKNYTEASHHISHEPTVER